ncbi:hypothetical protein K8T06_05960, partial [bacterium]|nr:hypothetical protein [bacterium]
MNREVNNSEKIKDESSETTRERLLFLLTTIEDMGETLTESESFDSAAKYLLRMLLGSIGISKGSIFTYSADKYLLRLKADTRDNDSTIEEFILTNETAKYMADNSVPHLIEALPTHMETALKDVINCWCNDRIQVIIPLSVKSELLGIVCLGNRFMDQLYSAVDLEVLELLTRHISLYFHSQKRLEHARSSNFELRRKILEMEQLFEVGLAITSLKNPDDLLQDILTRSIAILDARYGAIWMLKNGKYLLVESFGFMLTDEVPSIMPDLSGMADWDTCEKLKNPLCLLAQMKVHEDQLGVLSVAGKENRQGGYETFTETNYQLLTSLANQAAVAVENANLYNAAIEKERMDQEFAVAAEIQGALLPGVFPDN